MNEGSDLAIPLAPPQLSALRVLTFIHAFEPGGVERVALRLHRAWRNAGVDARLVLGRTDGAMRSEWPGLTYEVLKSVGIPTARWETLFMIVRLPAVIRRVRPDVLFCPGNSYTIVAVMMRLLLGRTCPPVIAKISNGLTRADMPALARPFYRLWLRIQGRVIDRLVGMAPPMRAEIGTMMNADDTRIAVIDDPSIDEGDIVRLELARAALPAATRAGRHFLAIGRLAPQKNFGLLLEAFARMAGPDDRLVIVGEGGERRMLESRIARFGLAGRVRMPGHINPLDAELLDADALVLSSDYEGVPAVVVEALAAGLPVVATDCSVSMADMLGNGRFGLLVPTGNVAALAQGMEEIAAFPFDRAAAREQARRFTVEIAAGRYLAEMEGLARV